MTHERVIGRDGGLPWHLPADLGHFKTTTMGKPIVMGRKTYESIGKRLPGRQNIVVTRNPDWDAAGVTAVNSLDAAIAACGEASEIMIIGGAQLYAAALSRADRMHITYVGQSIEGDTHFPDIDRSAWRMVERSATQFHGGIPFFFSRWQRRTATVATEHRRS